MSRIPGEECPACLQRLGEQVLAGLELTPAREKELRQDIERITARGLAKEEAPAFIASEFFAYVGGRTKGADPFAAKKQHDFVTARSAAERLSQAPDTFAARARLAIMGNALDHFCLADTSRLWEQGAPWSWAATTWNWPRPGCAPARG